VSPCRAQVTGIGFVGRADVGDAGIVSAASGDELVLFSLQVTEPSLGYLDSHLTQAAPTATLIEGASRVPLDLSADLLGDINKGWAAAVPKGVPVRLELAKAGFAQSFDLRAGRRVGPDPVALYRDPQQPDLNVSLGATQTLDATTSAGGSVSYQVQLQGATLSYFSPDPRTPPPGPDRGFLILNLQTANSTTTGVNAGIDATSPLPGTRVELRLADGTQITAVHQADPLGASGLLDGLYYFAVPGNLTTGRVVIDPGSAVPGYQRNGGTTDTPVTLRFAQPASFDFVFPAAQPAAPGANVGAASRRAGRQHSSSQAVLLIVALAVAAAAVGVLAVLRRRQGLAVRPVTHTRAALMAAAGIPALGWPAPHLGLPAAPAALTAGTPPANGHSPPPAATPKLVVRLLGPLEVEGLRHRLRRKPAIRLLVWLALNIGRPVGTDELRFTLATTDDNEPSEATLYSYASHLRQALPDGVLPSSDHSGYRLEGDIEVDWSTFQALAAQAATDPAAKPGLLRGALMLVRGQPLAHDSWAGVDQTIRHITTAIEQVAMDAARGALEIREPRAAEWAINQGLLALPASPLLWEARLIAAAAGSGYGLERAWTDAGRALGADLILLQPTRQRLQADLV
jgi:hypothetical protein